VRRLAIVLAPIGSVRAQPGWSRQGYQAYHAPHRRLSSEAEVDKVCPPRLPSASDGCPAQNLRAPKVTGDKPAVLSRGELRHLDVAFALDEKQASWVKLTAGWKVQQTRDIQTPHGQCLLVSGDLGISLGDRKQERFGIGMKRLLNEARCRPDLNDAPEVHHCDPALPCEIPRHGKVMGDEKERDAKFIFEP